MDILLEIYDILLIYVDWICFNFLCTLYGGIVVIKSFFCFRVLMCMFQYNLCYKKTWVSCCVQLFTYSPVVHTGTWEFSKWVECVCVSLQQCEVCVRADRVCVGEAAVWISQVGNTPVCVIRDTSPTLSARSAKVSARTHTHAASTFVRQSLHVVVVSLTVSVCICVCRCEWVCAVSRRVFGGRVRERHGKLQVCVSTWIQEQRPTDQLPRWRCSDRRCAASLRKQKLKCSRSVSPSDIDECQLNVCINARCENTPGSYRCVCRLGYRLTGNTCTGTALKPGVDENTFTCRRRLGLSKNPHLATRS